ncbi:MAG: DUF72 domain-containing protein [Myxococcota bacterium]
MALVRYRLGLPFWSFDDWTGTLFPADTRPPDRLRQYARVFNAVEGNTTFYHVPRPETVSRWAEQTPEAFRFCFKLPRALTHDALLHDVSARAAGFVDAMSPLGTRLGPFMIQLPPAFGPADLPRLADLLAALPAEHRYAVELRHPGFFDGGEAQHRARDCMARFGCDRVILDTRPLRDTGLDAGAAAHLSKALREARHRKPDLPVIEEALGPQPILRLIAHPDPRLSDPWLEHWSVRIAAWVEEGRRPVVFVHSPSNRESPELARRFHARLGRLLEVGALPRFPGEDGERADGQLALL